MKWYSDLARLRQRVGNRPVLLVCDYIFDRENAWFDQDWALFFLRRVNLEIPKYIGLYPDFGPYMRQAKSFIEPSAFVLVNGSIEGAIWKNERFSLFELADQARLIGVGTTVSLAAFAKLDWFQAPNGLELPNGKPFVWLGNNATRFLIVSSKAQTREIFRRGNIAGPGRPEDRDRHVRIAIGGNVFQAAVTGSLSIEVPLKPGLNYLDIVCQDPPTVSAPANSDPSVSARSLGLSNQQQRRGLELMPGSRSFSGFCPMQCKAGSQWLDQLLIRRVL